MFVHYTRILLAAEDRLNESERIKIAKTVEKWAEDHLKEDIVQIHRVLDKLIDHTLTKKDRLFLTLNKPISENTEIIDLLKDPKAIEPPEIIIANEELRCADNEYAKKFIDANLDGEDHELVSHILEMNLEDGYSLSTNGNCVQEYLSMVNPKIKKGRLLVPKKIARISLQNGKLEIKYIKGFSHDKVNQALYWYSKGLNPRHISKKIGIKEATLYDWLYRRMNLPRIGEDSSERKMASNEILRLYDSGFRPLEIANEIGCSPYKIYRNLKKFRNLDFGWGGPDPWVYELTGGITSIENLPGFDFRRISKWSYEERHKEIFNYVTIFEKENGRGPSRDELYETLGFQPWRYLQDFVTSGIFNKRKLPKEEMNI